MGITYEEMRQFYQGSEEREQKLIVKVQMLLNENAKLKKALAEKK